MNSTKKQWDYGQEGTRYPVNPEQVWRNGDHTFVCSDLLGSDLLGSVLRELPEVSLVYADPPWTPALLNGFRTKAGLPRAEHCYLDLYEAAARLAPVGAPVFLESGERQAPQVSDLLAAIRPEHETEGFRITYYRRSPATLHYSGPDLPDVLRAALSGADDEDTPRIVLSYFTPGLVLDPCAGRGLTARSAAACGWRSVSNELNPRRMSAALSRMGGEPERLGEWE